MSRILEELHRHVDEILTSKDLIIISENIREKTEAKKCELIYKFPYFIKKKAPISEIDGFINHNVEFKIVNDNGNCRQFFGIEVLTTSLCPCSKEISKASAHNQKCNIQVIFETGAWIWIEDVINVVENCASCEIFSILKRPDEKFITEKAYDNPCFVEDIARNVHHELNKQKEIISFRVKVISDESIHVHRAIAIAQKGEIDGDY
jgi:GTP cyclohydrolase I